MTEQSKTCPESYRRIENPKSLGDPAECVGESGPSHSLNFGFSILDFGLGSGRQKHDKNIFDPISGLLLRQSKIGNRKSKMAGAIGNRFRARGVWGRGSGAADGGESSALASSGRNIVVQ
jgi:hypothetical protein